MDYERKLVKLLIKNGYDVKEQLNFWHVTNKNVVGFIIKYNCDCEYINKKVIYYRGNVFFDTEENFTKWCHTKVVMNYQLDGLSEILDAVEKLSSKILTQPCRKEFPYIKTNQR